MVRLISPFFSLHNGWWSGRFAMQTTTQDEKKQSQEDQNSDGDDEKYQMMLNNRRCVCFDARYDERKGEQTLRSKPIFIKQKNGEDR